MQGIRARCNASQGLVAGDKDPAELTATDPAARWVTTKYEAGDLVVFGSKLMQLHIIVHLLPLRASCGNLHHHCPQAHYLFHKLIMQFILH